MKALGGKKKTEKVEKTVAVSSVVKPKVPAVAAAPMSIKNKGQKDHMALTRDSIKAKEQKEKEVVKEEDMAYSTDAITDYGANLNNIHDRYQNRFSMDAKKEGKFGLNDIEVSTLDDEEAPAQKKVAEVKSVAQKPAPAPAVPKPAEPVAPPRPMKNVEDALKTTGSKLVASLVEPPTTTVEAGGLKIEVSSLEDLD